MKRIALAAGLAALMAAPLAAQNTTSFAIMHFNMDEDSATEMRLVPMGDPVVVDLGMGSTLSDVFSHLNMDEDSMSDMRGGNGVTIIMSDPGQAADIFARLMAESAEDE